MKTETPVRRQYLELKAKHQDALLLFRLGDFYEAFDEDARILARELDIVLTSRSMGKSSSRVPLAGVPHFVLEKHLATLISRGHRVAICEQVSASAIKGDDGKKLIQREVVRVVTAGTIIEPSLLDSKSNNYLVAFFSDGSRAGIAYADITTGDVV
jgi:DNA mismatch repair protein MutS